ncbi:MULTISPECIES: EAL domain-containing protein [Cupriavidus]|jgi:EAL domain-containing protein (putative c-di-GMP-specific phosphodiesterase class I)|uniref:EAL domain-containing protein n=1 Tax=Cupriavidus sp. RAF20_2 TaxID=3233053 RepID=UPI003F91E408
MAWRDRFEGWSFSPVTWLVSLVVCAVTTASALWVGQQYAQQLVDRRESIVAQDVVAAIERIIATVEREGALHVAPLAGRPCAEIGRPLRERESYIPYARAAAVVANDVIYCSSARGEIKVPLSWYFGDNKAAARQQRIVLVGRTPFREQAPALVLYLPSATEPSQGAIFLIDGTYLVDTLAHGKEFGAGTIALSVGEATMDQDGTYRDAPTAIPRSTLARSTAYPLTVAVAASPAFSSELLHRYALFIGAIGLLLGLLAVAGFLAVAAPKRLLLQAVRQGLRRGEFHLAYQPIVAVRTRETIGVEAFLRWRHPRWGMIPPSSFIETVESTAVIDDITRFVLHQAVDDMNRYRPTRALHVAVNVAPLNLRRKGFAAELAALQASMPDGSGLVMEITERHLLADHGAAMEAFDRLHHAGIRLAVDDFGTRNNNLDMIRNFPFDYLKIDRQFTQDVSPDGRALLRSIVAMAHHFRLVVIAEGIESEAQHALLAEVGVDCAQGYLYRRPASAREILGDGEVQESKAVVAA